jgi:hypothetical protein
MIFTQGKSPEPKKHATKQTNPANGSLKLYNLTRGFLTRYGLFSLLFIRCSVLFCDIVLLFVNVFLLCIVLFIVLVLYCVCL